MAALDFISNDLVKAYLETCWFVHSELPVTNHGSYNITITVTNLTWSKVLQNQTNVFGTPALIDVSIFGILNGAIYTVLAQFRGFCTLAVIFGISLIASFISLHYLFKNWRMEASHMIVTDFTILISAFNIAIFVLKTRAMASNIANIICPGENWGLRGIGFAFDSDSPLSHLVNPFYRDEKTSINLTLSLIPIFLWISDAFILYRTWVVWVYHRKYTVVPAVVFLASLATGIVWLRAPDPQGDDGIAVLKSSINVFLDDAILRWVPALGFSCGLDTITTGMIAGRLIHHHRKQKKLTDGRSTIYLPVVTIFIESAALSLISKFVQIGLPYDLGNDPIVVPLCTISSNLIVLRKALGADVGQMLARGNQDLSALHFHVPSKPNTNTNGDDIPGGFESHLIQTIGGHIIDFGPLGQAETLVPQKEGQICHNLNSNDAQRVADSEARSSIQRPPKLSSGSIICPNFAPADVDNAVSSLATV